MKTNVLNVDLISLYLEVLQRPLLQRYNMKALILDTVPAKRMLYQVYMSVKGFDVHQPTEVLATLPANEIRFISFLEGTLFTEAERADIMQAHAAMGTDIPEQYRYRSPIQSKAFAYYGRKFGRQPIVSTREVDGLYRETSN